MNIKIAGYCLSFLLADRVFERELRARYRHFSSGGKAGYRIRTVVSKMPQEPFTPSVAEGEDWTILQRGDFRFFLDHKAGRGVLFVSPSIQSFDSFLRTFFSRLLLREGGLLLHCAGLIKSGKAHLFLGKSGAGKSTLSRLAASKLEVISDELNLVRREGRGFRVYGSPFWGELRNEGRQGAWPLAKVSILKKAKENKVSNMDKGEALSVILRCLLNFSKTPEISGSALGSAAELLGKVKVSRFEFTKRDGRFVNLI